MQGFGNAGSVLAELLCQGGYKVVAVSDSQGGIYSAQGLDIPSIRQYKESNKRMQAVYCQDTVCNIVEHQVLTNEELLALDVDILIPAALENQITEKMPQIFEQSLFLKLRTAPLILLQIGF